jgi:hypothetical protein
MIKDFIKIFKKSYREYNKAKLLSKESLWYLKTVLENQTDIYKKIVKLGDSVRDALGIVPNEAQIKLLAPVVNFVQFNDQGKLTESGVSDEIDALVLARHENVHEIGYLKRMETLCKYLSSDYENAKGYYKDGEYETCVEYIKRTINWYNETWRNINPNRIIEDKIDEVFKELK